MVNRPLSDVPPERYRTFYELPTFSARWSAIGLTGDDLLDLQAALMADPMAGNVVPGAGGLRKLRFAPSNRPSGKSGAVRVYYAHLPRFGVVVLAVAFGKGEMADIAPRQRKALAVAVASLQTALETRRTARRKE